MDGMPMGSYDWLGSAGRRLSLPVGRRRRVRLRESQALRALPIIISYGGIMMMMMRGADSDCEDDTSACLCD